jgi:hypothetical protein
MKKHHPGDRDWHKRHKPFCTQAKHSETPDSGILIHVRSLRTTRAIIKDVVMHMSFAQELHFFAVEESVDPVSEKFGGYNRRQESECYLHGVQRVRR